VKAENFLVLTQPSVCVCVCALVHFERLPCPCVTNRPLHSPLQGGACPARWSTPGWVFSSSLKTPATVRQRKDACQRLGITVRGTSHVLQVYFGERKLHLHVRLFAGSRSAYGSYGRVYYLKFNADRIPVVFLSRGKIRNLQLTYTYDCLKRKQEGKTLL